MRRWIVRILIAVACLLLIAAASVQVILWSNLPRTLVIGELQEKTGLEITAQKVSTGWFGHTTLSEVTFGLPLADQRIVSAPRIEVKHTSIPMMLLGRGVDIHKIELPQPTLHLSGDANGDWNAVRAIDSIRRAAQRETRRSATKIPRLPRVEIREATVLIERFGGDAYHAPPLDFVGEPRSALAWDFKGQMPGVLRFDGKLAPGSVWEHAVNFNLDAPAELLTQVHRDAPRHVSAQGNWRGQFRNDALTGRFDVRQLQLSAVSIGGSGSLAISADDSKRLVITDPQLKITHSEFADDVLHLTGGELSWGGQELRANRLHVHALHTDGVIDGRWNLATRSGDARAAWGGAVTRHNVQHRGTIDAIIQSPQVGERVLNLRISSRTETNERAAQVQMNVNATGPAWTDMSGVVDFPNIVLQGKDEIQLRGLSANVAMDWPVLQLTEVSVPNAQVSIQGQLNADDRAWSVEGAIENWQLMELPPLLRKAKLELRANGDAQHTELTTLELNHDAAHLTATGEYVHATNAVQGNIAIRGNPSAISNDAATRHPFLQSLQNIENPRGEFAFTGSVEPLDLHVKGELNAENFALGDTRLASLHVPITSRVQPEQSTFAASPVHLLGGQIALSGAIVEDGASVECDFQVQELSLRELAAALQLPVELHGEFAAQTRLRVPVQDWKAIQASGNWQIGEARFESESIERGEGKLSASNGRLQLSEVRLTKGASSITGDALLQNGGKAMKAKFTAEQWPIELRQFEAALTVDGHSDLSVDFTTKTATGTANLTATGAWRDIAFGPAHMQLEADGRAIHLRQFNGHFLGGTLRGTGSVPLADWRNAHATLSCSNLPLKSLAIFSPELERLEGAANTMLTLQPSADPRAIGPTLVELIVQSNEARFGEIEIGNVYLVAYPTPERIIIDRCELNVAGGWIHAWGRTSSHDGDQFVHVNTSFDRLNLDQIARTISPTLEPVPGLVTGSAMCGVYVEKPHRQFGQARIELTESDLANIPAVALIYSALNLQLGGPKATGEGRANIRLEGDALELSRLEYFNRGADLVARVRIEDIWRGGDSPIEGVVVGAMRPLKNIDLPFFSDLDRALEALQSGAASVRISGTVNQRETRLVPFAEISGALMRVLTGSAE